VTDYMHRLSPLAGTTKPSGSRTKPMRIRVCFALIIYDDALLSEKTLDRDSWEVVTKEAKVHKGL
jgi:hypothetical protein